MTFPEKIQSVFLTSGLTITYDKLNKLLLQLQKHQPVTQKSLLWCCYDLIQFMEIFPKLAQGYKISVIIQVLDIVKEGTDYSLGPVGIETCEFLFELAEQEHKNSLVKKLSPYHLNNL